MSPAFAPRLRAVVRNPGRVLLTAALAFAAMGATSGWTQNYTEGHGDVGIAYEDGEGFFLHYHLGPEALVDGQPVGNGPDGEEFEPGDIVTIVSAGLSATAPDLPGFHTQTGAAPGSTLWILPATQQAGAPFLGLATEELDSGDWSGDIVFTLGAVVSPSGNGHFSLWDNGAFGSFNFHYSTANPTGTVSGNNTITVPTGTHAHYNWAFTEPGIWEVTLTVTGTHVTDGPQSDTETLRFEVVPEPGTLMFSGLAALALGLRRRRAVRR